MENFKISVNVGAGASAIFMLSYEELLKRQHGIYELQIKVRPKQLVENFKITVDIAEPQEITFLEAKGSFMTNDLEEALKIQRDGNKARVVFSPSVEQQRVCSHCSETLLDGDFVLKYEVQRERSAGNIQIVSGYFVHYFAPSSLTKLPKNVVFVIDCSGSMRGRKMQQTLEAFTKILEELPEEDRFGILKFNSEVTEWKKNLVKAQPRNIQSAKEFVKGIFALGATDINGALLSAAEMLKNNQMLKDFPEVSVSIIIFLSDGDPTSGVTDLGAIRQNVREAVGSDASLYSLGFGADVDYDFLEKMSLENGGLARRIYEDSDSALQLQNFYKEVAIPLLRDVTLQYPDLQVNDLTQNSFRHYYQGSELIVAGRLQDQRTQALTGRVTARGVSEEFSMKVEGTVRGDPEISRLQSFIYEDFTERLWAYLTVEQLLTRQISAEGDDKRNVTEEALRLSLKYGFVTPLTSMVITAPEEQEERKKEVVAEKPKEGVHRFTERSSVAVDQHFSARVSTGVAWKQKKTSRLFSMSQGYSDLLPDLNHSPDPHAKDTIVVGVAGMPGSASELVGVAGMPGSASEYSGPEWIALLTIPHVTEKIFLRIDGSPDVWINLLNKSAEGTSLNGELSANKNSFSHLRFMRKSVKVDITPGNIIITKKHQTRTFTWTTAVRGLGYLKKEGSKLSFQLDGLRFHVLLSKNKSGLYLHVESLKEDSEYSMGLIGQMMMKDNILVEHNQITIGGEIYYAESSPACNFSTFGAQLSGSCIKIILKHSIA